MFRRVLVATDLSPGAETMLNCIDELFDIGVTDLLLVWVVDERSTKDTEAARIHQLERLGERKADLEDQGFKVDVAAPIGIPAQEIVRTAQEQSASLILISSRGRNTFRDFFLGSTVTDVVRLSSIPVLIERVELLPDLDARSCSLLFNQKFKTILLATDFSEPAHEAEELMATLAQFAEKVVVISVVDEGSTEQEVEQLLRKVGKKLLQIKADLAQRGAHEIEVRERIGIASNSIIRVAEQEDASLIVMGKRGKGALGGLYLGSTAEAVVQRARRPVLLIPFPEDPTAGR